MTNLSEERLAKLLELEKKEQERKVKHYEYAKRRQVKMQLLANKAIAAGITVSNEEIDRFIAEKINK
jgi:hypothetical protein